MGGGVSKELRGTEQHTGDVYRQGKPELQLPVPPYRNSLAPAGHSRPPAAPRTSRPAPSVPQKNIFRPRAVVRPAANGAEKLGQNVRDVPYQWQADTLRKKIPAELELIPSSAPVATAAVQAPRRRFALPLHFSIFPRTLLPRRRTRAAVKKKITLPRLV